MKKLSAMSNVLIFAAVIMIVLVLQLPGQLQLKQKQLQNSQPVFHHSISIVWLPERPTNLNNITFLVTPNHAPSVKKTVFWWNARKVGEDSQTPFTYSRGPCPAGRYTFGAVTVDAAGKTLAKKYIGVDVIAVDIKLSLNFTPRWPSPRNTITFTATSPYEKYIKRVSFQKNGKTVAEDTQPPFNCIAGPYPKGAFTFGVYAFDAGGNLLGRTFTHVEVK